jgi:2-oxoglutarate ferredoxin oxidoreductase subunit alpha
MKGNEVIGAAAIRAGCRYFFGYPITPQNELPEYMAVHLPEVGGAFVQAESEVAAINMVYGASGSGARVMTSSSSPGIALKQEGISYIAGAELPCVIVNVMRGGPGLGGIQPAQADYFQATRGGGNGDYRLLVYAPASLQEMADLVQIAFDKADYYRNPVMILADGMLGQMMEPVEFRDDLPRMTLQDKDWAATGTMGTRAPRVINSLHLKPEELEEHIHRLFEKYAEMTAKEPLAETVGLDGAQVVLVAYGTTARICKSAIALLAEEGIHAGLIRPITLFPYPMEAFTRLPESVTRLLVVEMSMGQMIDDVRIANEGRLPISFVGRTGGMVPTPKLIADTVRELLAGGTR